MIAKAKPQSRLTRELLEMSRDMVTSGIMDPVGFEKITKRHLAAGEPALHDLSGQDIRALREKANLSQAVFARYLNTSESTVEKWETGAKKPSGAALKLLSIVQKHGLQILA